MALYIGDVLKPNDGCAEQVRFRVRSVERVMESRPYCERGPMVNQYALQLYTFLSPGVWGWKDSTHDRYITDKAFALSGMVVVEKAQAQLSLF